MLLANRKITTKMVVLITLLITSAIFIFDLINPKLVLTQGLMPLNLNADGSLTIEQKQRVKELKDLGVELRFKVEPDSENFKPIDEFLFTDSSVDFVIGRDTGAILSDEITSNFSSLGVISYYPQLILIKGNETKIQRISDLRGKKVVIWTSPEGHSKPVFTPGGQRASLLSSDYLNEKILESAGITPDNTQIINAWPKPILSIPEWDVIITSLPQYSKMSSMQKYKYAGMRDALRDGSIKFAEIIDVDALCKTISGVYCINYPASGYDIASGIPSQSIRTLAFSNSIHVRNNVDSGTILVLAQYLKNNYSKESLFAQKGELPNLNNSEMLPPNPIVKEFYQKGMPFTRKYLSARNYAIASKVFFVLIPVFAILWPLITVIQSLYKHYVHTIIASHYKRLANIENKYALESVEGKQRLIEEIDALDTNLKNLHLPLFQYIYEREILDTREHIHFIRDRIREISIQKN